MKENETKPAEGQGEGEKVDPFACKVLNDMIDDLGSRSLTRVHVLSEKYKILELDFSMVGALWLLDCTDSNNPVIRKLPNQYAANIKTLSNNQIFVLQGNNIWIWHLSSDLAPIDYQLTDGIRISYRDDYFWGLDSKIVNIHQHFDQPRIELITDDLVLSQNENTVGLWNRNTGKNIIVSPLFPGLNDPIMYEVQLLESGCFLIIVEDADILWDRKNFYWLKGRYLAQLPDCNLLCLDDDLEICSGTTGKELKEIKGYKPIKDAIVLPDGRILSWSEEECLLRLWDYATGSCVGVLEGHTDAISGAKITTDGNVLSWSKDRTLRLWNVMNKECITIMEGHEDIIASVNLLPNNYIVSTTKDKTLYLWHIQNNHPVNIIKSETESNNKDFNYFGFENFYELNNGNLLLNFSRLLYLINGDDKSLIAMLPAFWVATRHFACGEKLNILSNSNFLIFSMNSHSELPPRIISGSTGKILPIAKNGQFIEKLGIIEDKIYFLLNDGSAGIQNIDIDEENQDKPVPITDFKSSIYNYKFSEVFNILGSGTGHTIRFIDHPMRWEADCAVVCEDKSDDGTYIVSAADGRVLCLKLYLGPRRITLDEFPEDEDDSRDR